MLATNIFLVSLRISREVLFFTGRLCTRVWTNAEEQEKMWIAEQNFCTLNFLSGIVAQKAYFIIREHQCLPWPSANEFRYVGSVEGGEVFEQTIIVSDDDGFLSNIRRVKVVLDYFYC